MTYPTNNCLNCKYRGYRMIPSHYYYLNNIFCRKKGTLVLIHTTCTDWTPDLLEVSMDTA